MGDGVDREPHERGLKFSRGHGSGMGGELEHPASEGQKFHRGSVACGRVLKLGLKGCDTS